MITLGECSYKREPQPLLGFWEPTGNPGENKMECRGQALTSSFVLSLVSCPYRVLCADALHVALQTRVPSAKRLHQHLSSTDCVQRCTGLGTSSWSLSSTALQTPRELRPLPSPLPDPYQAALPTPVQVRLCSRAEPLSLSSESGLPCLELSSLAPLPPFFDPRSFLYF